MMHGKELWAVFIIITTGAIIIVFAAVGALSHVLVLQGTSGKIDTSGWQTYYNLEAGFRLNYPPEWQISTTGLSGPAPFVAFGDPLEGTSTYTLDVFIENNPFELSSGEYVHQLLSDDKAEDEANAKNGPAPQVTPKFSKSYISTVGTYGAYELFDVFEFDHSAERVYVAHGGVVLQFDFPVAEENPNIALPMKNNAIAKDIMGTLTFTK